MLVEVTNKRICWFPSWASTHGVRSCLREGCITSLLNRLTQSTSFTSSRRPHTVYIAELLLSASLAESETYEEECLSSLEGRQIFPKIGINAFWKNVLYDSFFQATLHFAVSAERQLKCVKTSAYAQNSRFFERSPPWPRSITRVKEKFTKTCVTPKPRLPDTWAFYKSFRSVADLKLL